MKRSVKKSRRMCCGCFTPPPPRPRRRDGGNGSKQWESSLSGRPSAVGREDLSVRPRHRHWRGPESRGKGSSPLHLLCVDTGEQEQRLDHWNNKTTNNRKSSNADHSFITSQVDLWSLTGFYPPWQKLLCGICVICKSLFLCITRGFDIKSCRLINSAAWMSSMGFIVGLTLLGSLVGEVVRAADALCCSSGYCCWKGKLGGRDWSASRRRGDGAPPRWPCALSVTQRPALPVRGSWTEVWGTLFGRRKLGGRSETEERRNGGAPTWSCVAPS